MDKNDSLLQARQKLMDYLRLNSLRNTQERVAVLDYIYSNESSVSAEDLSRHMSEENRLRVSRATVYNSLSLFEDAGLVRKVLVNGQLLYERTDRNRGTIRLICDGCGKTTEMNDDRVRRQIGEMRTRRFTMTGWTLNVYGLCSKCYASLKRKQKKLMNNKTDIDKK